MFERAVVLDAVDLASWRWGVILCLSAAIWIRKAWDDDRRNHFYSPVEDNARPYHAWCMYDTILKNPFDMNNCLRCKPDSKARNFAL